MKKVLLVLAVACIGFAGCQRNESTPVVNNEEASKSVSEFFDEFNSAFKRKDAGSLAKFMSDDGLFLGSDPEEFWDKQRVIEEVSNMAQDTTVNANFTVNKREIRVSPDGQMALVIEQGVVPFMGKIPVRTIGHAAMKDGKWIIDFYSWSLVPTNESLDRLSEAYQ